MAQQKVSNVIGSIQFYWRTKWMNLPRRTFLTPLANSMLGMILNLPKHQGPIVQVRRFNDFDPEVESATDDTPKQFAEGLEPSTGKEFGAVLTKIPLGAFKDFVELGELLKDTDPTDLVKESFVLFLKMIRRQVHQSANSSFVKGGSDVNSFVSDPTELGQPFKTIFSSGALAFDELKEDSFHNMETWVNARSSMEISGVPPAFDDGFYAAVIDHSTKDQLMHDDSDFREVMRHMMNAGAQRRVFAGAQMVEYENIRWIIQHEGYRAALPALGGELTTRRKSGRVHVGHLLGEKAYAYADLAGKRRLNPGFKVQDITKTDTNMTIGYNIPFAVAPIIPDYGLNVAGTSRFFKGVND